jgi:hypothetical protein
MPDLSAAEQRTIDAAQHDGGGWVMPKDVPADLMETLAKAGLVRFWAQRWQLTRKGYACSQMSRHDFKK